MKIKLDAKYRTPNTLKCAGLLFRIAGYITLVVFILAFIVTIFGFFYANDSFLTKDILFLTILCALFSAAFFLLELFFNSLGIITEAALIYIDLHEGTKEEKNDIKE